MERAIFRLVAQCLNQGPWRSLYARLDLDTGEVCSVVQRLVVPLKSPNFMSFLLQGRWVSKSRNQHKARSKLFDSDTGCMLLQNVTWLWSGYTGSHFIVTGLWASNPAICSSKNSSCWCWCANKNFGHHSLSSICSKHKILKTGCLPHQV
jgi:hypothetical protein